MTDQNLYTRANMTVESFALLPDTELIDACLEGISQAWEALLVRYQRLIYSIPIRYGLPEHDANDVFQNVSILLLKNLVRLRDRERLGAWLVITTRRECWRMFHHNRQVVLNPETIDLNEQIPDTGHSEDDFLALERQTVVRAAVESLDSPCRQLLTQLFYAAPRPSYAEIAHALALPEGSIGPTRARCLEKLMRILEKMGLSES
jgi:RNA polymerase sigma factor (sigma-70 family)